MLHLYSVFHLNLMYSSIEEEARPEVIRRCYMPLLEIVENTDLRAGIELSGVTLQAIAEIDPGWVERFKAALDAGRCELVGSGFSQLIGPLVPASVNAANLRIGNAVYERLLGHAPRMALLNEQAYSGGMVGHLLDAGFTSLLMDLENPFSKNPGWDPSWRHRPQFAVGTDGREIPVVWNSSIAFQKLQRYVHDELSEEDYLAYVTRRAGDDPRALCIYGNDAEVFDFRPGRYATEPAETHGEWTRLASIFGRISSDERFRFILPGDTLSLMHPDAARLRLETASDPIPVKKQGKYNVVRWGVTGRNDAGINAACRRIWQSLDPAQPDDERWAELCYLWSSDFRTHITDTRWKRFLERLRAAESDVSDRPGKQVAMGTQRRAATWSSDDRWLDVTTSAAQVRLNLRKGLAVHAFGPAAGAPFVGTIEHGALEDISLGADYFTGHLVFETPGRPKLTDLARVEPEVSEGPDGLTVSATIATELGPIGKSVTVSYDSPEIVISYSLDWPSFPVGSLRAGYTTLKQDRARGGELWFETHNGGSDPERFDLSGERFDHGDAVNFLVSARAAAGMTEGWIRLGDGVNSVKAAVTEADLWPVAMVAHRGTTDGELCRMYFSLAEVDETRRPDASAADHPLRFAVRLTLEVEG